MKNKFVLISLLITFSSFADDGQFKIKNKFAEIIDGGHNIYHVFCGQNKKKNFCAIETLYVKKLDNEVCEINPTSWDSSSNFFEVVFDQAQKTFTVSSTLGSANKKLMYVISQNKITEYDDNGKFSGTILPKEKSILLNCKDVDFKTHLRNM